MYKLKNPFFWYAILLLVTAVNAILTVAYECRYANCMGAPQHTIEMLIAVAAGYLIIAYLFLQAAPTIPRLKMFMWFQFFQAVQFDLDFMRYKLIFLNSLDVKVSYMMMADKYDLKLALSYIPDLFSFDFMANSSIHYAGHVMIGYNIFALIFLIMSWRAIKWLKVNKDCWSSKCEM